MNAAAETYAAVDLGSNSFHIIIAEVVNGGHVKIIDRVKETICLAGGLDSNGRLTGAAVDAGLQCLERFGQRIRLLPTANIRAVSTYTLRAAQNRLHFLAKANKALGHQIEIISGQEEARLIYLGVAHTIFDAEERRFVIDIGGGSTELIIGTGFNIKAAQSLQMGCINMSRRFFGDGMITEEKMRQAILFARQELRHIEHQYKVLGWKNVLGTSGTINNINSIIRSQDWNGGSINAKALSRLRKDLIRRADVRKIDYLGLSKNRAPILAGGTAILVAIFAAFDIEVMGTSSGALREGLLYDLIGRFHEDDIRDKTIWALMERYSVDQGQANRVEATATAIFKQVAGNWKLSAKEDVKLLRWAACLHELGLAVAYSDYHKHGAYLLDYSDMPGFSQQEQHYLGLLVRCHRRKLSLSLFTKIPAADRKRLKRLSVILRLAVVLNRSRSHGLLPQIICTASRASIFIRFPVAWLEQHPLTAADLQDEANYLMAAKIKLKIQSADQQ